MNSTQQYLPHQGKPGARLDRPSKLANMTTINHFNDEFP